MARVLFLVAALVVAAAVIAEAGTNIIVPAPAPAIPTGTIKGSLSIKLVLHNVAHRPVTFKLVSPVVSKPVVCLKKKWNSIAPTLINAKHPILRVSVEVENNKHAIVEKNVTVNLLKHFNASELTGKKFVVLTAVESWSWKSKFLLITMGEIAISSIKL